MKADLSLAGRLFLLLSNALPALAVTALLPVLPTIEKSFSDTPASAAWTRGMLTSFSVATIIGSLCAGGLGARYGIRRTLLAALVVYAAAGVAGGLMPSLGALLATRCILGLATAVVGTLVVALTASSFDGPAMDKWMGRLAASATIGGLLAMPLSGLIGSLNWRLVFVVFLAALPLIGLLKYGFAAEQPARVVGSGQTASSALAAKAWILAPMAVGLGSVISATPMYVPFHLADVGSTSPNAIAFAMLVNAFAGVLGSLAYGTLRRRLSKPQIFAASLIAGAAGLVLVAYAQSYAGIVVALTLVGGGLGLSLPNLNAIAASIGTPEQAAKSIGLAMACFYAGGPVLQLGLETTSTTATAGTCLLMTSGLAVMLALLWFAANPLFRDPTPRGVSESIARSTNV